MGEDVIQSLWYHADQLRIFRSTTLVRDRNSDVIDKTQSPQKIPGRSAYTRNANIFERPRRWPRLPVPH